MSHHLVQVRCSFIRGALSHVSDKLAMVLIHNSKSEPTKTPQFQPTSPPTFNSQTYSQLTNLPTTQELTEPHYSSRSPYKMKSFGEALRGELISNEDEPRPVESNNSPSNRTLSSSVELRPVPSNRVQTSPNQSN